ncbi:beta-lactamase family protein [Dyadobacter sp. CY261]|uniref:serine hydrolase domain-containing protein n=1 Tax=Dyadobacter sp. CY261 TaxID=2907203 RepID=UPI001F220B36|nr:serine hydrolase domain-containing protein [Dyadobacter sp. CY261]MCF0070356.1 beta-lactamase family protein [Dyadobacter sp. CY261]
MKRYLPLILSLCLFLAGVLACKKDKDPDPVDEDPAMKFVRILDDSLKDKGFGYSFAVYKKDQLIGSGVGGYYARQVEVQEDKPVTLDTKMQIASMTKTITAAAFLKLAKEKGIKTTDKIIDYLPRTWVKGPNIDLITFKDLLTHTSGIIGMGENCRNGAYTENVWYGLKLLIQMGIRKENHGSSCYQNANFGLFRVLIPAINGLQFSGNDENDALFALRAYEEYVQKNVFQKAGIVTDEFLTNSFPTPTFGYDFPYSGEFGFDPGDFSTTTGGYGIYLSASQGVKLYAALFSTENNTVITQDIRDEIITNGLGSYSAVMPEGKFSYHDGWWYSGITVLNPKGFRSVWMHCPEDITVVLFTNALRNGDGLFPLRSEFYQDITSYVLWAFSQYKDPNRGKRARRVNFHDYLEHPEPH